MTVFPDEFVSLLSKFEKLAIVVSTSEVLLEQACSVGFRFEFEPLLDTSLLSTFVFDLFFPSLSRNGGGALDICGTLSK